MTDAEQIAELRLEVYLLWAEIEHLKGILHVNVQNTDMLTTLAEHSAQQAMRQKQAMRRGPGPVMRSGAHNLEVIER
jgi:hypothetical protein